MPIISSLGALAYPKASFVTFGAGRGYMLAAAGSIQSFNRAGDNGNSFDARFSSVGADSSGNMYIQGCQIPSGPLLVDGIAYPIQVDDTDASPQFDFSKALTQGFGAITTTGNDTFYPQDVYVSGSGSQAIFANYADKTAAGSGITGLDFGSGTFLSGSRLLYNSGKANLTDMMVLSYSKNTNNSNTEMYAYGHNGAESGRIYTGTFNNLFARNGVSCTNDAGVTIMACFNSGANKYYLGRPQQFAGGTTWLFETNSLIKDIDCDDDYVYVSCSNGEVAKVDIVTGSVVTSYVFTQYGQGRYIKVADDGDVYLCNTGVSRLDKNLNMQWNYEVKFQYFPAVAVGPVSAGTNGFTVRDNFIYMLGSNAVYGLFGVKIPSDGTLVSPAAWNFGTGQAYNKFETIALPGRTAGTFTLSTLTTSDIFCANVGTLTPTTKTAQSVSSTGIVTSNQAIG